HESRAGTSTGTAISGSIRKPSLVSFMQESCCPRDGCKPPSCLADIAERLGSGSLRLTVWQNLLLSDIAENQLPAAIAAIGGLGLGTSASAIRGGMVACTGNIGCRFALSDTKRHGVELVDYLDRRLTLDQPLNIHLTGCPNSCAQHYVGDIGLL